MFLVDIVRIENQTSDNSSPTSGVPLISFGKRQRWHNVVSTMLRHQPKHYNFPESDATRLFIETQLQIASTKDPAWFWSRSQEVQHLELAHADIRRGLVEAGF
jgi:son of sevenless-like protein